MQDSDLFITELPDTVAGVGTVVGQEDPTTLEVGEEGDEPTTMATGEEGDEPTTLEVGEEGDEPTTMATGEEGDETGY